MFDLAYSLKYNIFLWMHVDFYRVSITQTIGYVTWVMWAPQIGLEGHKIHLDFFPFSLTSKLIVGFVCTLRRCLHLLLKCVLGNPITTEQC